MVTEFQALLGCNPKAVRSCLQNSIKVRMRVRMKVRVREQDGVWVEVFAGIWWRFRMRFRTILWLRVRD